MGTPPYVGFSQLECYRQWHSSSYHLVFLVSFILKNPYPAKASSSSPYRHVPHTHKEDIRQENSHFCEARQPGCGCLYPWCRRDSTFMGSVPSICPSDLLSLWTGICAGQAFRDDWPVVWLLQAPCFWVMGVSGLLRRAVASISGFLAFMHQHKGNLRQSYFIFLLIQDQSPYNPLVL